MFTLLRPEDTIRLVATLSSVLFKKKNKDALTICIKPDCIKSSLILFQAVRLESAFPQSTRYMVVVSTNGRQDTEESVVLGMDFINSNWSVFLT